MQLILINIKQCSCSWKVKSYSTCYAWAMSIHIRHIEISCVIAKYWRFEHWEWWLCDWRTEQVNALYVLRTRMQAAQTAVHLKKCDCIDFRSQWSYCSISISFYFFRSLSRFLPFRFGMYDIHTFQQTENINIWFLNEIADFSFLLRWASDEWSLICNFKLRLPLSRWFLMKW